MKHVKTSHNDTSDMQYLQEHGLQYEDHSDEEELDKNNAGPAEGDKDDETSRCGVCQKPEEEDEDGNNSWIECDNWLTWYHVLCIPAGHEIPNGNNDHDENDVPKELSISLISNST